MESTDLSIPRWDARPLTKSAGIFLAVTTIAILLVGIALLVFDLNEAFATTIPWLYTIFSILTEIGSEYAYIVVFAILYIAIDKEFARRLIFSFLITLHITTFTKLLFQDPRPPSNLVDGTPVEEGYGFPSGHTSGTISFWGYIFYHVGVHPRKGVRQVVSIVTFAFLIIVPVSRLIIGVHDLADVVGGYTISLILLGAYFFFEPRVRAILAEWSYGKMIGVGVLCSLILWVLSGGILLLTYPAEGIAQLEEIAQPIGLFIGLCVALPLENQFIQYDPRTLSPIQKVCAGLLGAILTFGVYFGLSLLLKPLPAQFLLRAVRYSLLAIVAGVGIPALCSRIFKVKTA